MVRGYSAEETDEAVQQNIVAAGYGGMASQGGRDRQ